MFSHVWQEPCHVQIGAAVNLEVDIVGKYVERMMKGYNASVTSLAWRVLLKVFSIFWCIADNLPICCPMEGTKVQYTAVDVKTLCILQLHLCFWMILLCIEPLSKIVPSFMLNMFLLLDVMVQAIYEYSFDCVATSS